MPPGTSRPRAGTLYEVTPFPFTHHPRGLSVDLSKLTDELKDLAGDAAESVKGKLQDAATEAADTVRQQAEGKLNELTGNLSDAVTDKMKGMFGTK